MMEIYYFSGTGNSLHIAKILCKKSPGSRIIPIVSLYGNSNNKASSDVIGFIFPIHFLTVPKIVMEFIHNLDIDSSVYVFAIATRMGTPHRAFTEIEKELMKKGRNLDAHFSLTMGNNDPKSKIGFAPFLSSEEIKKNESVLNKELETIYKDIYERIARKETDTKISIPIFPLLLSITFFLDPVRELGMSLGFKSSFYSNENCISCELCQRVCLSGKIIIKNGKPCWQKNIKCLYCYACLNFCPNFAVQIKGWTEKNGRYSHPYATANDIAEQKKKR